MGHQTHHVVCHADLQSTTCPQSEEGIERVEWLDRHGVEQALNNTFPNIREILETYLSLYPLP